MTRPSASIAAAPARYAAFLSYCHADRAQAEALHRFLETYRLPRDLPALDDTGVPAEARLRPVFVDRTDMVAATDLRGEIDTALAASGALIVMCSPAAAKSRWVDLEIERYKQHHGETRIFAVIIDGVAHGSESPQTADRECFPPALRIRQTPGGPVRADPAAVDLRRSGDGSLIGRLRLVAGLIGVPLDQLVHRDARRRHRRTLALVIGLSLALAGTSALALFALRARNEAQRQRFAAEGMIEFMIGDLRKTLEPMGRLSAMDPLGKRALDYYRRQDAGALDADSLARRARVLILVGEIQDQRGNLDTALSNFQAAAGTTRELLERTPNDPKRIFDHAQSVYWVGYIAYRRGNFATAEPAFKEYSRLADRLVAIDPKNPDFEAEKGYAYGNLGTLWFVLGRNKDAEAALRTSLAVAARVADREPTGVQEKLDLATAHAFVADALVRQGKFPAAMAERNLERAVLDKILATDPLNGQARDALSNAKRASARIALEQDDMLLALDLATQSARESRAVAAIDRTNAEAIARAAVAEVTLGEVLLANRNLDDAAVAASRARGYAAILTARDRSVANWQLTEVRELLLRSRIAAERDAPAEVLALAESALSRLAAMGESGRATSEARWLSYSANLEAGRSAIALGSEVKGRQLLNSVLSDEAGLHSDIEPRVLKVQIAAAQVLGDEIKAKQLSTALIRQDASSKQ